MSNQRIFAAFAVVAGLGLASPALADKPTGIPEPGGTLCTLADIGPTASACAGWYKDNLNGGSPAQKAASAIALNTLLGLTGADALTGPGLTWLEGGDFSGNTIDFGTALYGKTVIAVHVGGANGDKDHPGVGYTSTAFFVFDAGNLVGGLDKIDFNRGGLSNARLYSTGSYTPPGAVPEPATWAMLIAGFGLVGGVARRRKTRVTFA